MVTALIVVGGGLLYFALIGLAGRYLTSDDQGYEDF